MKIAAYQAPLLPSGSLEAIDLIRERVAWCDSQGVSILCCPEAILGGLADYCDPPARSAISVGSGELEHILAPLKSATVTSIIGFTELGSDSSLYNSACVYQDGRIAGVYRKAHPAIRKSVYSPGSLAPVFKLDGLTFGALICNETNYSEPGREMVKLGAKVLFVPSNNGLPVGRGGAEIVRETRAVDIARAIESGVWIVRADVVGRSGELSSYGASCVIDPRGRVVREAETGFVGTLAVDLDEAASDIS